MKEFGERLKELRTEKNISATKLGKMIGVDGTTVLRWESEQMNPTIDKLTLICKFFGVTADYLLGLEDWNLKQELNIIKILDILNAFCLVCFFSKKN